MTPYIVQGKKNPVTPHHPLQQQRHDPNTGHYCSNQSQGTRKNHHETNAYLMTGTSDDGGEDGTGRVISGETGLAHAGAIVHDQSGNFVLHFGCVWVGLATVKNKQERTWKKYQVSVSIKMKKKNQISGFSYLMNDGYTVDKSIVHETALPSESQSSPALLYST